MAAGHAGAHRRVAGDGGGGGGGGGGDRAAVRAAHHRAPRVEPPVGLTERKRVVVAVRLPAQRGVRGVVEVQVLSNPDLRAYLDRTIDFAITPVQKLPYSKAGFR